MNIFNNKIEFRLENVIETNKKYPRSFLIPDKEEIEKLVEGDTIKLIFVMKKPQKNGCRAEKMWVKIINKQNGFLTGILDNDPYYIKSIKAGDTINFKSENIACIFGGKAKFDDKLFAIITQKALDLKQINWVVRSDNSNNEQDSGWQLFFGDENEQYLDDAKNSKIISLGKVLSFEPLLESVFSSQGNAFEYSEQDNKFVEVKE